MEEKNGNLNQGRKKKVAFILFPAIIMGAVTLYLYLQYKKTHITTEEFTSSPQRFPEPLRLSLLRTISL
jgi:hypothetical protein